jgi:Fe-S oxidoreductase
MKQLTAQGRDVVTMCPICLLNLEKAARGNGTTVRDISEHLLEAYGVDADSARESRAG